MTLSIVRYLRGELVTHSIVIKIDEIPRDLNLCPLATTLLSRMKNIGIIETYG